MKKLSKILSVFMIALMLMAITTNVFAEKININQISSNANLNGATTNMTKIGSVVLTLVTNVGIILSVVVIAILGVKYMMGSTEEKAEYKKAMIPYIVGAVLVFGASAIGKIAMGLGQAI